MDYFGKYTEHIRYLTSLSGNFTSCSNRVRLLCMVLILPTMPLILGRVPVLALTAVAAGLTVISLADYIIKNIRVITEGSM